MAITIACRKQKFTVIVFMISLLAVTCLSSCDVDLFGTNWKQIADGYRLLKSETPHECGVVPPGQDFGSAATEVGWHKPLIIYRGSETKRWTVIDTRTRIEKIVSDNELTSNPAYSEIKVYTADIAWHRLRRYKRQW